MPKSRPKSKIKNRKSKIIWERLLLIHQRIKSGTFPSASALAAELETFRRTLKSTCSCRPHRQNRSFPESEVSFLTFIDFDSGPPRQILCLGINRVQSSSLSKPGMQGTF